LKEVKVKEDFIRLRAEGYSFDSISKKINVSKPTLIKWQKEFEREIGNLTYLNLQSLIEQYRMTKEHSIEFLVTELKRINEAIGKRSYDELSLKELHNLQASLIERFRELISKVYYKTGEFEKSHINGISFGEKEVIYPLN
jgi:hypothetical protein